MYIIYTAVVYVDHFTFKHDEVKQAKTSDAIRCWFNNGPPSVKHTRHLANVTQVPMYT